MRTERVAVGKVERVEGWEGFGAQASLIESSVRVLGFRLEACGFQGSRSGFQGSSPRFEGPGPGFRGPGRKVSGSCLGHHAVELSGCPLVSLL